MIDDNEKNANSSGSSDNGEASKQDPAKQSIEDVENVGLRSTVINRSKRGNKNKPLLVAVGAFLLAGVALTVYKAWNNEFTGGSRISRPPSIDTTPAGQQLAESERYKQSLDTVNREGSQQAEKDGSSFIATPDEPLRDIDEKPKAQTNFRKPVAPANTPEPEVREAIVTKKAEQAPPPPDYSRINQLAAQIAGQAREYQSGWAPVGSTNTIVLNQTLYKTPEQRRQEALERQQAAQASGLVTGDGLPNNAINAGQFAFGRVINSTDSDTPGPVVVEIMKKGPLYKARMIGAFQKNNTTNALIVQFDRIVFADGREAPASAYAVDATKGSIAVKSEVDRRLFSRYAPLIAASFIEGLGQTLSESGDQVIYGSNYATVSRNKPRFEQGLYAGAGKVGQRMAQDIEQSAPKGPLVKLNAGKTVGVLFLQSVELTQSASIDTGGFE